MKQEIRKELRLCIDKASDYINNACKLIVKAKMELATIEAILIMEKSFVLFNKVRDLEYKLPDSKMRDIMEDIQKINKKIIMEVEE